MLTYGATYAWVSTPEAYALVLGVAGIGRDLWPLRTSLEISKNVFSSTEREPLGW
jgi:hypothetical protein